MAEINGLAKIVNNFDAFFLLRFLVICCHVE